MEDENKQRVKRDIEQAARNQPDHRIGRVALQPQLVVEHQRGGHPRRADQDQAHVVERIGKDGVGCAEQVAQRVPKHQPERQNDRTRAEGGEKAGRGHAGGLLAVLRAELARDVVARALSEEKADCLDRCHQREHHADRAGRARAEPADKERIRHVVNRGDEHADDGRHGHFADQRLDRGFGKLLIFAGLCVIFHRLPPLYILLIII